MAKQFVLAALLLGTVLLSTHAGNLRLGSGCESFKDCDGCLTSCENSGTFKGCLGFRGRHCQWCAPTKWSQSKGFCVTAQPTGEEKRCPMGHYKRDRKAPSEPKNTCDMAFPRVSISGVSPDRETRQYQSVTMLNHEGIPSRPSRALHEVAPGRIVSDNDQVAFDITPGVQVIQVKEWARSGHRGGRFMEPNRPQWGTALCVAFTLDEAVTGGKDGHHLKSYVFEAGARYPSPEPRVGSENTPCSAALEQLAPFGDTMPTPYPPIPAYAISRKAEWNAAIVKLGGLPPKEDMEAHKFASTKIGERGGTQCMWGPDVVVTLAINKPHPTNQDEQGDPTGYRVAVHLKRVDDDAGNRNIPRCPASGDVVRLRHMLAMERVVKVKEDITAVIRKEEEQRKAQSTAGKQHTTGPKPYDSAASAKPSSTTSSCGTGHSDDDDRRMCFSLYDWFGSLFGSSAEDNTEAKVKAAKAAAAADPEAKAKAAKAAMEAKVQKEVDNILGQHFEFSKLLTEDFLKIIDALSKRIGQPGLPYKIVKTGKRTDIKLDKKTATKAVRKVYMALHPDRFASSKDDVVQSLPDDQSKKDYTEAWSNYISVAKTKFAELK